MQYLFFKSENRLTDEDISKIKKSFESTTSICNEHINYEWLSNDNKTYFLGRNPKLEIYEKYNVFHVDKDNNLFFIHGWVKEQDKDELMDAKNLNFSKKLDGYFNAGKIDSNGFGIIQSSNLHPSIYKAESSESFSISNRISALSKIFSFTTINKKYIATHIQYQSSSVNFDTMFKNIYQIPFSSKIKIDNKLNIEQVYDYLYDEILQKKYLDNKKDYWDECYRKMLSQVKAFVNLGVKDKFILGISGGKDSRLLLSLYHEYINSTFSWGPLFSPEVIVGRMVCESLNLKHKINYNNTQPNYTNLMQIMPQHLFCREFEMCPWDFGVIPNNLRETISIDGQEFVKVKPFPKQTIDSLFKSNTEKYEENDTITSYYNDLISQDAYDYIDEYINNLHDPLKFSIIKRQLERGRWVSRVHDSIFDHSFNIYPLITNVALTYAYNIENDAMNLEEFHFELMKRSNPKLIEIPFFNAQLNLNPVPPIENKIPGKTNYKNVYLMEYYGYIMEYINSNFYLISDIVKEEFIKTLTKEKLFNNSVLSQKVYNILQYILLLKVNNYEDLKNNIKLNWEINVDEANDTYNEDILKAYIEYNNDIVNLKKENKKIKENKHVSTADLKNNDSNKKIGELHEKLDFEKQKNSLTNEYLLLLEAILKDYEAKKYELNESKHSIDNLNKQLSYFKSNIGTEPKTGLNKYFTARIDIKNFGSSQNSIEILKNSDSNSKIDSPNWFNNKEGKGKIILSENGSINLEIKCLTNGILKIWLRGIDFRDNEHNRIPIYIKFTEFKINNDNIINKPTNVWHDKPLLFTKEIKDSEIINLSLKWEALN